MRLTIVTLAALALVSCNQAEAPADNAADANATVDLNAADANVTVDANSAATALASLNETTWEFTEDGKPMQESIDAVLASRDSRTLADSDDALRRFYRDPSRFGVDERTGAPIAFERSERP